MIPASMKSVAACGLAALLLSACGAGERIGALNPFGREEGDDPDAPAQSERISVLALEEQLNAESTGPLVLPRSYVNTAWPQPDGYPTHAMQHTGASGDLNRLWRTDIGSGSNNDRRLNARPVIAGGVVYAIDAEGRVSAHDLETGEQQWSVRLRGTEREGVGGGFIPFIGGRGDEVLTFGGGLSWDAGRLYVHSGGHFIVALDAASGEELWRQTALTPFHSAPTVSEGRVYVTTDDNELLALDAAEGEVLWTHRSISETARLLTAPSVAVLGETVIAPFTSGEIVALRAQNGTVLWSDSLTRTGGLTPLSSINDIAASPVILGESVYAMSHSGIMAAFDLRTGERRWSLPASGLHAPYIAGDYLFLVTTNAEVVAIDRNAGEVRWIQQLASFRNERRRRDRISWAGPVLAGDRLVLASSEGDLIMLDPSTGDRIGERDLNDPVFIAPVIANETLVVLTDDGRLIALR